MCRGTASDGQVTGRRRVAAGKQQREGKGPKMAGCGIQWEEMVAWRRPREGMAAARKEATEGGEEIS